MKKIILMIIMALTLASCHKEGEIAVVFRVCNKTESNLTVEFSSWGDYKVNHDGRWVTPHEFHASESVGANGEITMIVSVKDEDYEGLPPTITPAWDYISGIECMRVKVPSTYYKDPTNWTIYRTADMINGEEIVAELRLTPEILAELNK